MHVDHSSEIPRGWAAAFAQPTGGWDCYETWAEVPAELRPAPSSASTVPQEVTMRQARLALLQAGKLDAVNAAINGMPSPQKAAAQIEWEYSNTVRRNQRLVLDLGPALGLDSAALDALFVAADAL